MLSREGAAGFVLGLAVGYRLGMEWCERYVSTPCRVCGLLGGAHELGCPYGPRPPGRGSARVPPRP